MLYILFYSQLPFCLLVNLTMGSKGVHSFDAFSIVFVPIVEYVGTLDCDKSVNAAGSVPTVFFLPCKTQLFCFTMFVGHSVLNQDS